MHKRFCHPTELAVGRQILALTSAELEILETDLATHMGDSEC